MLVKIKRLESEQESVNPKAIEFMEFVVNNPKSIGILDGVSCWSLRKIQSLVYDIANVCKSIKMDYTVSRKPKKEWGGTEFASYFGILSFENGATVVTTNSGRNGIKEDWIFHYAD